MQNWLVEIRTVHKRVVVLTETLSMVGDDHHEGIWTHCREQLSDYVIHIGHFTGVERHLRGSVPLRQALHPLAGVFWDWY